MFEVGCSEVVVGRGEAAVQPGSVCFAVVLVIVLKGCSTGSGYLDEVLTSLNEVKLAFRALACAVQSSTTASSGFK